MFWIVPRVRSSSEIPWNGPPELPVVANLKVSSVSGSTKFDLGPGGFLYAILKGAWPGQDFAEIRESFINFMLLRRVCCRINAKFALGGGVRSNPFGNGEVPTRYRLLVMHYAENSLQGRLTMLHDVSRKPENVAFEIYNMIYKAHFNLYECNEEELTEMVVSCRERTTPYLSEVPKFIYRPEVIKKPPPSSRSSSVPEPIIPGPITLRAFKGPDPGFDAGDVRYDSIFNELMTKLEMRYEPPPPVLSPTRSHQRRSRSHQRRSQSRQCRSQSR